MTQLPLIVAADDNEDIRRLLGRRLSRRGWEVALAADGAQALQLIRERVPQAAILDGSMPGLTGQEVVEHLRADAATATLPVVLLSARVGDDDREAGLAAGADAYLGKPFDVDELDATLRRLTAGAHRRDATT